MTFHALMQISEKFTKLNCLKYPEKFNEFMIHFSYPIIFARVEIHIKYGAYQQACFMHFFKSIFKMFSRKIHQISRDYSSLLSTYAHVI